MTVRDPTDGKPGLRIETAASVMLRDMILQHMTQFRVVISKDRAAGQAVVAAYIDGLAAAMALVIAGSHAGKQECADEVSKKLADALERDLKHLKRG